MCYNSAFCRFLTVILIGMSCIGFICGVVFTSDISYQILKIKKDFNIQESCSKFFNSTITNYNYGYKVIGDVYVNNNTYKLTYPAEEIIILPTTKKYIEKINDYLIQTTNFTCYRNNDYNFTIDNSDYMWLIGTLLVCTLLFLFLFSVSVCLIKKMNKRISYYSYEPL